MIFKKLISFVLVILLVLSFIGCTVENNYSDVSAPNGYVIDASGELHKIPDKESVTIASVYAVSVPFIVALGLSENVKAINCKSIFWTDNVEGLAKAGSVGRGVIDLELLAKYSPDVLIHRANDPAAAISVKEKLDIPVIAISAETIEEIYTTLDLLGTYCNVKDRAEEVKDWMTEKFNKIAELSSSIPEEERLTAVVFGGEIGIVAGGDMLQSWMLEHAGAVSLTSGIKSNIGGDKASAWANIGTESIFNINPDVIFCTSSTVLGYSLEQLLQNPTWSSIKAVDSQKVFQIPAKLDSWDLPGVSCVIGTIWMLHKLYPDIISKEELLTEIDEYYMFMFNETFTVDYLGFEL